MTREEMLTEVIRTRGFEDKWTIWFSELMENETISDSALQNAMVAAIAMPFDDENEDYSSSSFLCMARWRSGQRVFSLYHSHRVLSIDKLYKKLREKYPEIGQNFFQKPLDFPGAW